jgi:hypothetical protein
MRESPFFQHILDDGRKEARRGDILTVLEERFGVESANQVKDVVNGIEELTQLNDLLRLAARYREFAEFRAALPRPRRVRSRRQS